MVPSYFLPPAGVQRTEVNWAMVAFWLAYFGTYLNVVLFFML